MSTCIGCKLWDPNPRQYMDERTSHGHRLRALATLAIRRGPLGRGNVLVMSFYSYV